MTVSCFPKKGGNSSPNQSRQPTPRVVGISTDMQAFAKEAADLLCGESSTGLVGYQRAVSHEKYGERLVSVVPKLIPKGDKLQNCASADPLAGTINLFLVPNQILDPKTITGLIEHELVHIFDPKLNQRELKNRPWGIKESNARGELGLALSPDLNQCSIYLRQPWELDAYMAATSLKVVREALEHSESGDLSLASFAFHKPTTTYEQVWKEDPKLWRRYLKTLYATALQLFKGDG